MSHEKQISELSRRLVEVLEAEDGDSLIKAAALRSAVEIYTQSATMQAILASMYQTLKR